MQVQLKFNPSPVQAAAPAEKLETAFLAEMLKHAMPQGPSGSFGGGTGEAQFASFRTEQLAQSLAQALDLRLDLRTGGRDA